MQRLLHIIFFFIFRYRATIMRLTMVILVSVIPRAFFGLMYLHPVLSKKDIIVINT